MTQSIRRLSLGVLALLGLCAAIVAGVTYAQTQVRQNVSTSQPEGDYTVFDTPQATLLVDRKSGEVWRIGYTEVGTHRYWFSTYVPREPITTFSDFQNRLRKEMGNAPRDR